MSLLETWHFNISNCDHCYSSLMWDIWWLTHSPTCSALPPCPLGPFGSCVSFTRTVPSAWKCSRLPPPWPRLYTSFFRLQTLPDTHLLPSQISYDSSLGRYLYFIAFISVLKLFIYLHNYLKIYTFFLIGCKPCDCRSQFAWCVKC